jgi:hypothetical protein
MESAIREIIRATSRTLQSSERLELVLRMYRMLGLFVATLAAVYFAANKFDIKLDSKDQAALSLAAAAASVAFFSNFGIEFLRQKRKLLSLHEKKTALSSSLLNSWTDLEKLVLSMDDAEKSGPVSIRALLKEIGKQGVVSPSQIERLESALRTRNLVAHGVDDAVSNEEIIAALEAISDLIVELYPHRNLRVHG